MASVTKSRVRVNKNKKKNWKKYTDIKEIEEFLEDVRHNERIGGAVEEKSDDNIFFVEKQKNAARATKRNKILKPLRCFQNLQSYSEVPPPIIPCHTRRTTKSKVRNKKNQLELQTTSEKKKNDSLKHVATFDLWNEKLASVSTKAKVPEYRYQKPSLLPAVEVPHAGASYNPSFKDHQNLLSEAHMTEVKKVTEEKKLHRNLTQKFPTVDEAPTEDSWLKEMSQGLFDESEDSDTNSEDGSHALKFSSVVHENRKPKAKKRREREQKVKQRQLDEMKTEKQRMNNVYRLKQIQKELDADEKMSLRKQKSKSQREISMMYRPRRIGRHKYQAPDLELNLKDELTGSLRTIKVEGNILEDRYKSFQRRNIIEPRIRQKMKRKYKLKVFEKRGHKNIK